MNKTVTTIGEACDYLQPIAKSAAIENYGLALDLVLTAAKYRMPKVYYYRLNDKKTKMVKCCPTCNSVLNEKRKQLFCGVCGQRIEWGRLRKETTTEKATRRGRNEKEKPNT